ncbi:MAG: tRNA preQ1(34) S-adenosylmethionine ribosyltransferase-isomerase QueA [Dehalococcoidia bacterium]|nr:tRNA preQ1(34) S-adenosylmethionine ribosyltransferase-isomerase QueA [Dehalococcoidia bacterium]
MKTSDFDYHLPPELIAQTPLEPRDSCRLLVLDRRTGSVEHRSFRDLPDYLDPGDVVVMNDSRVLPGRLVGRREATGGRVELLLLRRLGPGTWMVMARPARALRPGVRARVPRAGHEDLEVVVLEAEPDGVRVVRLSTEEGLEVWGQVPLPPYIHARLEDPEAYQTVYAREPGSAAAPTAGLHFTRELLDGLRSRGVELAFVTLHVGLDTFAPVRADDPAAHSIHGEYFELVEREACKLREARASGRRIMAVGTTSVRVLEQVASGLDSGDRMDISETSGWADVYILPGHRFRMVDAMVTNFHLPRTTLLMLVSAFAGREQVLEAYGQAIRRGYRFYSFGDAMLLV